MFEEPIKIELYKQFRQELDDICTPEILKHMPSKLLYHEGEFAGIICAAPDYIDAIYVLPKYRRMGIAKRAVLEHYHENKKYDIHLHIINENKPALKFWNSIFRIELITKNEVDGLYRIKGVKKGTEK